MFLYCKNLLSFKMIGVWMFDFLLKPSCKHEKIAPNVAAGYCPDCGEYVENHWYITRCKCCGVKQKTLVKNGKISTDAKFCRNCGSSTFVSEELNGIDIVNINYAIVLKQVVETQKPSFIQTWIEKNAPMKLLPSY